MESTIDWDKLSNDELIGGEPPLLDRDEELKRLRQMIEQLTDDEKKQIPCPSMLAQHLRAEKGDVKLGLAHLRAALEWRKSFGVDLILRATADKVDDTTNDAELLHETNAMLREENATGKIYVRGYDKNGRALLYMRPARENTHHEEHNLQHLVYSLEKAIACTARESKKRNSSKQESLEKINLIIDYHGFRMRDAPPMSTSRKTLDILQKYYPERLHRAYIANPPFVFRTFWTIIRPFVDPVTKKKVVFCTGGASEVVEDVGDESILEPVAGGTNKKEFDSKTYMDLPFDVSFDERQ